MIVDIEERINIISQKEYLDEDGVRELIRLLKEYADQELGGNS